MREFEEYRLALIASGYTPEMAQKIVEGMYIFTTSITTTNEGK
jgi:hypothetical protein